MKHNIISFRSLQSGTGESGLLAVLAVLSVLSIGASFHQGGQMLKHISQPGFPAAMATNVINFQPVVVTAS